MCYHARKGRVLRTYLCIRPPTLTDAVRTVDRTICNHAKRTVHVECEVHAERLYTTHGVCQLIQFLSVQLFYVPETMKTASTTTDNTRA